MDFFQAQDRAIRKTKLLVFYFALAVFFIIAAVYLAVTAGFIFYHSQAAFPAPGPLFGVALFDPARLAATLAGVLALVGVGSLYKTLALRGGGAAVANSLGGQLVDRDTRQADRRQLLNVVEEMAIASGVPVPGVYILPGEGSINAFAAGWGFDDAVIAVSQGALEQLSRDELQGVVAHEYSHLLYGDSRLNIRLMGMLFGIMMLTVFARMMQLFLRGGARTTGHRPVVRGGGKGGGKGGGGVLILAILLVIVLVTIIGFIGTFFGRLIQAAISRQREFLADAAAVQFTRNPGGIAGALKRVAAHAERGVLRHPGAGEAAHMFFADGMRKSFSSVFATHPPLKERIQQIDPGWDGSLDLPQRARPRAAPAMAQPAARQQASGRDALERIGGMAVLASIGTMGSENLATARGIRSAIPGALDERMREPEGARQAILALVMSDNSADDAAQWQLVEAASPPETIAMLRETAGLIRDMPREARLGVLELASTTLAQAGGSGQEAFLALIDQLIAADQGTSLFEVCVRRIVKERVNRGSRVPEGADPVNHMAISAEVSAALGTVLSVVAREATKAADPAALVDRAVSGLYSLKGKVAYREAGDSIDEALDILRGCAYAIRAQFLRAVVACITEDGQLAPAEAEVLRMIALSLDCPVPPLGLR